MTRIEDMSETERQSWMTLIVDVFVFIWFWKQMTSGFGQSFQIMDYPIKGIVSNYVAVIVITILLHIGISIYFEMRRRKDDDKSKDERDLIIERKGAANGFRFLAIAINVVIVQILLENSLNGHETFVSLAKVSHLYFVLLAVAFIGDIIKNGTMVLAYRGE